MTPSSRYDGVLTALSDDLNFPAAFGALFTAGDDKNYTPAADLLSFERALRALGIKLKTFIRLDDDCLASDVAIAVVINIPAEVTALAEKRWAAKKAKDFKGADALRAELTAAGWSMLDGKDGYKLEPLKK
jgi:cysteinyl-tRNA synthetase